MWSWILAATFAAATAAAPPELKRAEELMAQYKYAEARSALGKARGARNLDRESLLRILELQGVAAGQMRQDAAAAAAFRELLILNPSHKLAAEYAPRVMTPFFEAGQLVHEKGFLDFRAADAELGPKSVTAISVEVKRDPLKMARSVVFHVAEGSGWMTAQAELRGSRATLSVNRAEVSWWAELLGENDAQLVLVGSAAEPQVASIPPPTLAPPLPPPAPPLVASTPPASGAAPAAVAPHRSTWVRTTSYFVLSGAVICAGIGTFWGVRSNGSRAQINNLKPNQDGIIDPTQPGNMTKAAANVLATNAGHQGLYANVSFLAATVLGITGGLMWWFGAPVAITPSPGGIVVSGTLP